MNKLIKLSKAQTLDFFKNKLLCAKVLPLYYFKVKEWPKLKNHIHTILKKELGNGPFIVRSSSKNEDKKSESNAGKFLSLLNIKFENLEDAINKVVYSYDSKKSIKDEVLIQPMLNYVIRSGVVFSHDPNTCSPYRVVNWTEGKNTTKVTSGYGGKSWQIAALAPSPKSKVFKPLIALLEELLVYYHNKPIDYEFAVTSKDKQQTLWLLQARPLILKKKPESEKKQIEKLKIIEAKIEIGMKKHPFLIGRKSLYGVMPDWNPAEILGIRPKPLALSLYRELITDNIWAYQRHNYGYRNLRSFPLMLHFYGLPYIDVRLSFNSFIPNDLDDNLAGKLVDYYIKRLLEKPTLHDKIEFEIVFSCFTLDLPEQLKILKENKFSDDECKTLSDSLKYLTNKILHPQNGLWIKDQKKIKQLKIRRDQILSSNVGIIEKIYWLLEDGKRYGTLPFAGLARAGFIAVQMLKSLVNLKIFSDKDYDAFVGCISNISSLLTEDRTHLNKKDFLLKYGHLRPGTYDILSPRYDEKPDLYFNWKEKTFLSKKIPAFKPSDEQVYKINNLLKQYEIECNAEQLLDFIESGIKLREFSKFSFTQNLSEILYLISKIGKNYKFTKNDMAFSDITIFKDFHISAGNEKKILNNSIKNGKYRYNQSQLLSLPPLITKPKDVLSFKWPKTAPNFITQKQITAHISSSNNINTLRGSLVCIRSADPGFDWLFSYEIAGLITAWGGVNSHMAIRAGELGLPSVIGCGELLFKKWSKAKLVFLDCAGRRLEILK